MRTFPTYKRKPIRLNRRVGAPAPTATVNIQKITKRAFDGRALHGLKRLHYANYIRYFFVSRSTDRTAHAHVSHRGTPGVRSLQAEKQYTKPDRLIRQKVGSDSEAL